MLLAQQQKVQEAEEYRPQCRCVGVGVFAGASVVSTDFLCVVSNADFLCLTSLSPGVSLGMDLSPWHRRWFCEDLQAHSKVSHTASGPSSKAGGGGAFYIHTNMHKYMYAHSHLHLPT